MKKKENPHIIAGVGSPVVDQVAKVPNNFLETIRGEKGGMELVDEEELALLLASLPKPPHRAAVPGIPPLPWPGLVFPADL